MSSLETQKNRKKTVPTTRKKAGTTTRSKKTAPQIALREPTRDEIARRAHELFLARGGAHGRAADDWFRAEQELRSQRTKALGGKRGRGSPKGDA